MSETPVKNPGDEESFEGLGELQREVVRIVWASAPVTAEAVRERLSRPLRESTVRSVLRKLEEKGYISHTVDGRGYVYDVVSATRSGGCAGGPARR